MLYIVEGKYDGDNKNVIDNELIEKIDIYFSKRNTKRYRCCKQEQPVKIDYAIEYPEKINSIVLIGTPYEIPKKANITK